MTFHDDDDGDGDDDDDADDDDDHDDVFCQVESDARLALAW